MINEQKLETFLINKLVRNNTINICEKDNIIISYEIINNNIQYQKLLCLKLKEEAEELYRELDQKNQDTINEETADVIEVFNELMTELNILIKPIDIILNQNIQNIRDKKNQYRGAFFSKIYLKTMSIPKDHRLYNIFCKSYKKTKN